MNSSPPCDAVASLFTPCISHQTFTTADHQGLSEDQRGFTSLHFLRCQHGSALAVDPSEDTAPWAPQLFLIMSRSGVLQVWVFLVGLWQQAHCATLPGRPSAPPEGAGVPVPHLRMLSLGLDHLLKGVEGHSRTLEKRGQQGAQELEQATKHLEELSKQSLQTGRTHRQVGSKQSGNISDFYRGRCLAGSCYPTALLFGVILENVKRVSVHSKIVKLFFHL